MHEDSTLRLAPGSRAAFHFGLWALLTLLLLPISWALAITAIVQHQKAKGWAEYAPAVYHKPSSSGLVMGIVALAAAPLILAFVGILSAIAVPAMLTQRARARERVAVEQLNKAVSELSFHYDMLALKKMPAADVKAGLEARLVQVGAQAHNAWNPAQPAYVYAITVTQDQTDESLVEAAKGLAQQPGACVFCVRFPEKARAMSGYLVGAVQVQDVRGGYTHRVKTATL